MNSLISSTGMLLAGIGLLFPAPASTSEIPIELEPIQVRTASRSSQDLADVPVPVSVITAEDIRLSAAEDLFELLRLEAGVDIVRTGGPGQQTSVFMRGGNSNHTLVLIDGIRASSAHTGAYAWEHLPLNLVERVEIVRGPRGSMYGSDAIGGVIQIFTRVPDASSMRATAGSHGSRELEVSTGSEWGAGRFFVAAAYLDTDGFSAQNPAGFSFHPDNDGFEARNVHLGGNGATSAGDWQFRLTGIDNLVDFDEGVSSSEQVLASFAWSGRQSERWTYRFYAGWDDDQLVSDFGFFTSRFDSSRLDVGWENRLQFETGALVFGLDHYEEEGESEFNYVGSRDNTGLFALWTRPVGEASLSLSGRLDDNSLFGSEFTHQAAVQFAVGARTELVLSHGTAFRAPNLGEQFSPGFGGLFAGNPSLDPESSASTEMLVRIDTGASSQLSIAAYRTRVEDLIAFTGPDFQAVNIHRAALDGMELEYRFDRGAWSLSTNLTLQKTEDRATGSELLRRPEEKASLQVSRRFAGDAWMTGEWFVSGDQADVGGVRLPGYSLINLSVGLPLAADWRVEGRLDNLLDHAYEPARGFNSAGRAVHISLAWSP